MKLEDQRTQKTTEAFTNIKMLKLYGWEERFAEQIGDDLEEVNKLRDTQKLPDALVSASQAIILGMIPLVIFSTYVYLGNTMTIADTMLATMMFDRIKGPINRIPNIFNNTVEMNDSVDRLQEFLMSQDK